MTNHQQSTIAIPLFSPLIERAMRWAARCHRHHHRKGSDLPYISHPVSAALLLIRAGIQDDEVLAAALMHDVVEDTDCSLETLATQFPPRVVTLVAALTERKHDHDGQKRTWLERKTEHLEHMAAAPWEARAIVLADKLHNLGSMVFDLDNGEELWSRFSAPPEKVLWYHRAMVEAAGQGEPHLSPLIHQCLEMLDRLAESV